MDLASDAIACSVIHGAGRHLQSQEQNQQGKINNFLIFVNLSIKNALRDVTYNGKQHNTIAQKIQASAKRKQENFVFSGKTIKFAEFETKPPRFAKIWHGGFYVLHNSFGTIAKLLTFNGLYRKIHP